MYWTYTFDIHDWLYFSIIFLPVFLFAMVKGLIYMMIIMFRNVIGVLLPDSHNKYDNYDIDYKSTSYFII